MAIELMDGADGTLHVSSEDWATFNEAVFGETKLVFDWGNNFALTMSSANSGTLGTGAGLVDGKRFWIKTAETVTVESGAQGMKRNDIIGVLYETYTSGDATLERAVVKTVKGTASSSTAADPTLPSNFIALWRVPLDGISIGTPVQLFEPMVSESEFRDSIYQVVICNYSEASIPANSFKEYSIVVNAPSGYTPLAIVEFRTYSSFCPIIGAFLSGGRAVVHVRNDTSSVRTAGPMVKVLCIRDDLA